MRSPTLLMTTIRRLLALTLLPLAAAGATLLTQPTAAHAVTISSWEQAVVNATNKVRAQHGCPALHTDGRLQAATYRHSNDMASHNFFSHTGSDKSTFAGRDKAAGYSWPMAENIAYGYTDANKLVAAWMNSTAHRTNILNCKARAVGVGTAKNAKGTLYITQNFGGV
jgi:uncharacterized protein YkwD